MPMKTIPLYLKFNTLVNLLTFLSKHVGQGNNAKKLFFFVDLIHFKDRIFKENVFIILFFTFLCQKLL